MSMERTITGPKDYSDGRTKQAFKDSCDINKILKKAQKQGTLSHLLKYPEAVYGEFDGEMDLLTAHGRIERAQQIFDDLPSEIRSEFKGNALEYVKYVNDPANKGRLAELLPQIAEPGSFFPNPAQRGGQGAGAATAPSTPQDSAPAQEVPNASTQASEPSSEPPASSAT
jgi:hypothetical protein